MLLAAISILLTSICEASWSETVYSFEASQQEAPTQLSQDWTVHKDDYWVTGFHYAWSPWSIDVQFEWYYGRPSGAVNTASQPTETLDITTTFNENDYSRICSSNYAIYSVESTYSYFSSDYDRLFSIICKKLPPQYTTGSCKWLPEGDNVHDYLNYNSDISDDGQSFDYKCGDSPYADTPALLTGIKSNYGYDDYWHIGYRRFKFRCCDIQYNPIDIVNEYDNSRVLVQIESIFDINGVRTLKMTGFGKPKWYTQNGGNPVASVYPLMRTYDDSRSFVRICPKNGAFSSITSNDDNTFNFECAELHNDVVMSDCKWTDYLHAFGDIFTGETGLCPKDGGIRGIQTYYSLRSDDYKIKSYCCEFKSGTFDSNPPIYIKATILRNTFDRFGLITFDLCWNGDLYQGSELLNTKYYARECDITKYDSCGTERLLTVSMDSTDILTIESIAVVDHNVEYIINSFYDHTSYSESATNQTVENFVLDKDDESVTAFTIKFPHDYLTECQGGDGCIGDLYLLEDFKLYLITLTPCASFVLSTAGNRVMNTNGGECRDEDGKQRPDHTTDMKTFTDVAINECKSKLVDEYLKDPSYVTAEYNKDLQQCLILKQLGYTGNGESDFECITMKTNHDESDIGVTFEDTKGQCRNSDGSMDINHKLNWEEFSGTLAYCKDRFMDLYESDNTFLWMEYAHRGVCWIGHEDRGYTGNGNSGYTCYNMVSLENTDTDAVYSNLDLERTRGLCRYSDGSIAADHSSSLDFTVSSRKECENQLIVKHIEDPQYVNAQYDTGAGKCRLRTQHDYTGNGVSGYECSKIIYSTDIGVIVRGLKGNLDKEILEGPISDEEFVGFGNIGDVFHVSIEYESGDDYCIERATLFDEFNGIQEYGREYFGDGIIVSKSCETDPDFRRLSGNKYVPCYDTAFNIITYGASLYTSVQIHACDGDKGGVGTNSKKLSLTITGKTDVDSDIFIQSDPLSLQSSSEWESGESRDYTLALFGAMKEISLLTITNNDENDYLCVDSVIINGEDAFLKDYWVGLDNAADADDDSGVKQTIPAVLKWPICKVELTTTIEARSTLPTNPDTVATSTCVNRNRLTSVDCDISQSIETYVEVSWEHQMGEELSNEITMERGTSMEFSASLTLRAGVEYGGNAGSTKTIFGADMTGGWNRETSESKSTSNGKTTIDITTDGTVNGESISVDCSGSVSVPPSQQMEYSLMLDRTTASLKTLTDMKMTKCSKYLYNKDEDDPNDYIYIDAIEGELTETSATNCYVSFSQSEQVNADITCGEERALATREWGSYIPMCDPNDSTYYDPCQCAFGIHFEQKTCGCVDTLTGNLRPESEASVVSETEEYKWTDWCKDHCGINGSVIFEAETGSAKAPPSNVEPIVMNEDLIDEISERNKKEKFPEYNFNNLYIAISILIGVFIYGLKSCYEYKLNTNKYHSVPTFYSETEVEKV